MPKARVIPPGALEVRRSPVHGKGVFAIAPISKGARLIEYVGERVSHREADRRYESKDANDNHTFLFIVDSRTVIDAGVDGNDARFFNHSCDPNCESVIEDGRVYIEAIRAVQPGEELTYDYQIQREDEDPPDIDVIFACRCGAPECRGTMLWPAKRPARKKSRKTAASKTGARKKSRAKSAAGGSLRSKSGAKNRAAKQGGRRR